MAVDVSRLCGRIVVALCMSRLVLVNMGGVLAGEIVGKVQMQMLTQVARREMLYAFEGLLLVRMLTRTNRFLLDLIVSLKSFQLKGLLVFLLLGCN